MAASRSSGCVTGKRRYGDRLSALITLADIGAHGNAKHDEKRAYHCPKCHGWHLTSKSRYEAPGVSSWPRRKRPYEPPSVDGRDD